MLILSPETPFHETWEFTLEHKICHEFGLGPHCKERSCRCTHGIIPPGYHKGTVPCVRLQSVPAANSALTSQGLGRSEVNMLEYFLHGSGRYLRHKGEHRETSPLLKFWKVTKRRRKRTSTSRKKLFFRPDLCIAGSAPPEVVLIIALRGS